MFDLTRERKFWKLYIPVIYGSEFCCISTYFFTYQFVNKIQACEYLSIPLEKLRECDIVLKWVNTLFNSFQPTIVFDIKTNILFCSAEQMTGFCIKCSTVLKWFKKENSGLVNGVETKIN